MKRMIIKWRTIVMVKLGAGERKPNEYLRGE
jgi:hypothetical protein